MPAMSKILIYEPRAQKKHLDAYYMRVHIIFRHLIWVNKSLQPINYNRSEAIANNMIVWWKRWQEKRN